MDGQTITILVGLAVFISPLYALYFRFDGKLDTLSRQHGKLGDRLAHIEGKLDIPLSPD